MKNREYYFSEFGQSKPEENGLTTIRKDIITAAQDSDILFCKVDYIGGTRLTIFGEGQYRGKFFKNTPRDYTSTILQKMKI